MDLNDLLKDLKTHARSSWSALSLEENCFLVDLGTTWYVVDRKTMIELMKSRRTQWNIAR